MYPWLNNFPTKFYVHCSSFANFFWSLNSTGSLSKIGPFCGNPASGKFEENGKITASLAIWNLTRKGNSETFVSADCIELLDQFWGRTKFSDEFAWNLRRTEFMRTLIPFQREEWKKFAILLLKQIASRPTWLWRRPMSPLQPFRMVENSCISLVLNSFTRKSCQAK